METYTYIYTIPQWIIFAGVISLIFGWTERRKSFRIIGLAFFILLAVFSIPVLTGDYFMPDEFAGIEEIVDEAIDEDIIDEIVEDEIINRNLFMQVRLFPAYLSFLISGLAAVPAAICEWKDKKVRVWLSVLTVLIALFGFFIIAGTLKNM